MNLPSITAVCLAYGNSDLVRQAIANFQQQKYEGRKELLVFNSFPKQTLVATNCPGVTIINRTERPPSLGACRNLAIGMATGQVIVTFDADDCFLPHHLQVFGEAFAETDAEWVRINPVFYAERYQIKGTFQTWANAVAFTKAAWEKAGRYRDDLTVGEDRNFLGRLTEKCAGATVELQDHEISAIYNWATGTFHVSGNGDDRPGQLPAYERARLELEERVRRKREPVGVVHLNPSMDREPAAMAKEYLDRKERSLKKNSVCLVELGRYGDIINILPIARHIAAVYDRPHLMVSKEFAGLLEGVSYVIPHPVGLRNDQLMEAMQLARRQFKHVIQCQIWGKDYVQEKLTTSYNRESWRMAGFLPQFDNRHWAYMPVFDRRNHDREREIARKLFLTEKPKVLLSLRGTSSPFKHAQALKAWLGVALGNEVELVDISDLRLPHFYDTLGLLDQCDALVSIDTSLIHLAAATDVPLVALVNDKPWLGSEVRAMNRIARISYDVAAESPDTVISAVRKALQDKNIPHPVFETRQPPQRNVLHVVERHADKTGSQRVRRAQASWDALYDQGVIPCHYWNYERSALAIGDPRALPYLKDVLRFGMDQASDEDVIMWTNDDNWLHPELADMVRFHCSLWDVCCSQRCEFGCAIKPGQTPAEYARQSRRHMGRDMFAFTKRWLVQNWAEIPDFILGSSDFDLCLASMLRLKWGIESNRQNLEEIFWPCELERGYICHEYHDPKWRDPKVEHVAAAQIHNRKLFRAWAETRLPNLKFLQHNCI